MCQVLFWIPLHHLADWLPNIPIYGFGTMLFIAFVLCTWVAGNLAQREGIPRERIQDLAIWLFVFGLSGARLLYVLNPQNNTSILSFFAIWDGGLVYYGSFLGGVLGFVLAYRIFLRKYHISPWKLADIISPSIALGLCLGRIGCLLNGCCYGNTTCPHCVGISFPLSAPPRFDFVLRGLQTAAGFTMKENDPVGTVVGKVEPDSDAFKNGLRDGDTILKINGKETASYEELYRFFTKDWEKGRNDIDMTVRHADGREEELPPIVPRTVALYPTQIFESISMGLLFLVLMGFYWLKRPEGSAFVLFMVAYAVHRFLNEMLRTDTEKVAFGMTLSQNISILMLVAAALLGLWICRPKSSVPPLAA